MLLAAYTDRISLSLHCRSFYSCYQCTVNFPPTLRDQRKIKVATKYSRTTSKALVRALDQLNNYAVSQMSVWELLCTVESAPRHLGCLSAFSPKRSCTSEEISLILGTLYNTAEFIKLSLSNRHVAIRPAFLLIC